MSNNDINLNILECKSATPTLSTLTRIILI